MIISKSPLILVTSHSQNSAFLNLDGGFGGLGNRTSLVNNRVDQQPFAVICCCVGRHACVGLTCASTCDAALWDWAIASPSPSSHTWSVPKAPDPGNTKYSVPSIIVRSSARYRSRRNKPGFRNQWVVKLNLLQSGIDAIKQDRRPIIALVERVGVFIATKSCYNIPSTELSRSGAGYQQPERAEWRNLIRQTDRFIQTWTWWKPFHTLHHIG